MDVRLDGKAAIVTGASSGIGKSIAMCLADAGAAVSVVADKNVAGGTHTVEQIVRSGGRAVFVQADVSVAADCARIVADTVSAFGGVDILVNNAGITTQAMLEQMDEEFWDRTLDTNLKSVYLMSRQVAGWMLKRGSGSVVNIGSIRATATDPGFSAYTASKAGMRGLTRALACEFGGRGIRFNCVEPGTIDTSLDSDHEEIGSQDARRPRHSEAQVMKRHGSPDEVAGVVCFLASEQASYVNGSMVLVDGGLVTRLGDT